MASNRSSSPSMRSRSTTPSPPASPSPNLKGAKSAKSAKGAKGAKGAKKAPPIATLFQPRNPASPAPPLPNKNEAWGCIPTSLAPHPMQPPARSSNAQTVPQLWEDRGHRFQLGSRFVGSFAPHDHNDADDSDSDDDDDGNAANLDQESLLRIQLIDMRPTNRRDPTPRRAPIYYEFERGAPVDWSNKQAIKALNDRRQQAIDRITLDRPWLSTEREYLASVFRRFPDASILEATERLNTHFTDRDDDDSGANFVLGGFQPRTVESVRFEYLSSQTLYNNGQAPHTRKRAKRNRDDDDDDDDDQGRPVKRNKTATPQKPSIKGSKTPVRPHGPKRGKTPAKQASGATHPVRTLSSIFAQDPATFETGDLIDDLSNLVQHLVGTGARLLRLIALVNAIDADVDQHADDDNDDDGDDAHSDDDNA